MSEKGYSTGWLHFFYRIRVPFGVIFSLGGAALGVNGVLVPAQLPLLYAIGIIGGVLSGICALGYIAVYFGYVKGRYFDIYPYWVYPLTLALLWVECGAAFLAYALNPIMLIGFLIFGVCNTVYFVHRRYLYYKKSE